MWCQKDAVKQPQVGRYGRMAGGVSQRLLQARVGMGLTLKDRLGPLQRDSSAPSFPTRSQESRCSPQN